MTHSSDYKNGTYCVHTCCVIWVSCHELTGGFREAVEFEMFNLGSLAPVIPVIASLIVPSYSLSKGHSHVLFTELFISVIITADDMFYPAACPCTAPWLRTSTLTVTSTKLWLSTKPTTSTWSAGHPHCIAGFQGSYAILTSFILHVSPRLLNDVAHDPHIK